MVKLLRLAKEKTHIRFMKFSRYAVIASLAGLVVSILLLIVVGLNFGIDFKGGIIMEIRDKEDIADVSYIREVLNDLDAGDVEVQEFGSDGDVLIRVERPQGGDEVHQQLIAKIRNALGDAYEYRRVEMVGPRVSQELALDGAIAVVTALFLVLLYIWIRFEWQFAVGAVMALIHDVVLTLGLLTITGYEFNLSIIAAILTIVGYSLNDTVVVYDRIRDNLRKYKKMAISDIIDLSINGTLSRTLMTSTTTLIALLSLFVFGGAVIKGFTFAMIWGVLVGTYSSVVIAAPLLIFLKLRPDQIARGTVGDSKKADVDDSYEKS